MKDKLKRTIMRDIYGAIGLPSALYLAGDLAEYLTAVYTANILAGFADAVLRMDAGYGLANAARLAGAAALTVLISPFIGCAAENIDLKYALRLDRKIMSRFMSKRYEAAMKIDVGEAAQRLEDDAIELRCAVRAVTENAVLVPAILAYLLYSALQISPVMTAAVFAVSLIKLLVPAVTAKMKARFADAERDYKSSARGIETQITSQPHVLRLLGLGGIMTGRLERLFGNHYDSVLKRSIPYETAADSISGALDTLCTVLLLISGALMAASGMISPGSIAAMIGYFGVFGTLFGKIGEIIKEAPDIGMLTGRMALLYGDTERENGSDISGFTVIRAESLSYSYDGGSSAIPPVSFTLRADGKTAVTGPNGSGKSTLIKILCGLLDSFGGSICADGVSLSGIHPSSWRKLIAYAPQDPFLFAGTVRENILLGNLSAADREIDGMISRLGLGEISGREAGDGGDGLSGGERQRISIARALLRRAPLLLLDEPSNNLDADGVETICRVIREYRGSVLYISHLPKLTAAGDAEIRLG